MKNHGKYNWTPKNIREMRKSLKLTQQAMADQLGITRGHLSHLEMDSCNRTPGRTLSILLSMIHLAPERHESVERVAPSDMSASPAHL